MKDLAEYRLEAADEKLKSSRILLEAGQYKDSIGRSYYAIFSAVRALLAEREVDFARHAGVIAYFQKEYIKTHLLDAKYSKYVQYAFQIRNSCDYDDFYIASRSDAVEQFENAAEFISAVRTFLGRNPEL